MPNVLVFESDAKFASELKGELQQRGCVVTVVDDAAVGLQTASVDKPDLILLAIEMPRMNGFSVCNKLKRDPALKEVPLIIMSSDSTEETFEQHRRLRTHAEDYVHKPIAFADLLPRINVQLPLSGGSVRPSASPDDIVIDDDIDFVESKSMAPPPVDEAAAVPQVDDEVDAFTESAFGSMVDEPAPPPAPASAAPTPVAEAPPMTSASLSHRASEYPPLDIEPMALASSLPPPAIEAPSIEVPPAERALTSIPPRPRADSVDQAIRDENAKLTDKARDLEKDLRETRARFAELEDQAQRAVSKDAEVQRLQRELDDVKAKAASAGSGRGGGSAREFLDLREALNKKDKELLDLRDQLTHKEKELLGLRDTNLVAEREKADLSDRIADLEKQGTDVARQLDGARADKEQAAKRADDFKRKSEKQQAELEAKAADAAELKQKLDEEMAGRAARETAFETQLRETGERAEQVRAMAVTAAEERSFDRGRAEAQAETGRLLADAALQSSKDKEQALLAREADLKREHDARLAALHRANEDATSRLKAEHAQMLADEDKASLERIQELEVRLALQHEAAMNAQTSAHAATKSELIDALALLESLKSDKAAGEVSRDARIAALEQDVAERANALSTVHATLQEREGTLAAAAASLTATAQELAEIRAKLAAEQARAERAFAKWSDDKASLERAKDALAAALAQMDEIEARPIE